MAARQSETVAVGMSGGVDSSVAAAILKSEGYEVLGLTAVMTHGPSRCCSDEDVLTAGRVAEQIGIPHHTVDIHDEFQSRIIDYFVTEYTGGRTPSPCVECNALIKFGVLVEKARELGAARVATGHYARVGRDGSGDRFRLLRGVDAAKDQSYFLARLGQDQLSAALFPLGSMTKKQVSGRAAELELHSRKSKESQELCFIAEGSHGTWIDVRHLNAPGKGDIVDSSGRKLGEHRGIHHYTIGQRKGLGIAVGSPVYVTRIEAARNAIVVGPRDEALRPGATVEDVVWTSGGPPAMPLSVDTQIRYNHKAAASTVTGTRDDAVEVCFEEPQFAVTPGQLAVFYDGAAVLGAGWIR